MKARDFTYERPASLEAALVLLSDESKDILPLAGGQSLMPMMNFRMAAPDLLVDLAAIEELRGIRLTETHIEIGAMTRYSDLSLSPIIQDHAPLIMLALPHIAHSAIRNRGTLGGSVALADPAAEMPAVLLALGAEILVRRHDQQRTISIDDFFGGLFETACEADELICSIRIPRKKEDQKFAFYELARRHGDYAMAGVAVAQSGPDVRIAFFGVSDRPCRAEGAEALLSGQNLGNDAATGQAIEALGEIEFAEDLNGEAKTKRHLAGIVLKRALKQLAS